MTAYLALGANVGDRADTLRAAVRLLEARVGRLLASSGFHETRPSGFRSDHLFLNAAAAFETSLPPSELLRVTQEIERELGRTGKSRPGIYRDRPIDIDLLLLDGSTCALPGLTLPHPRLHERRFVLAPLAEIAPDARHPLLGRTIRELLQDLDRKAAVEVVRRCDAETLSALQALLPQLSDHTRPFGEAELRALVRNPSTRLYVLRDEEGLIRGTATLCLCASPSGTKAWVEDVVVDAGCRGRGYGRRLVAHCQAEARRAGMDKAMLTSRPARRAANALYRSLGFRLRETNVYDFDPSQVREGQA